MTRTLLAADIGGTNLRTAIVTEDGQIQARSSSPTNPRHTPEQILAHITAALQATAAQAPTPPAAACIAVPGLVNADAGTIIFAPNVAGFRNLNLTAPIQQTLRIPTYIENDASAAALGEARFGAGRGLRHLLHATLGTGIGGGIVIDGRLYRGARGLAGEIGHIVMDPAGPTCKCGSRGCLEAMVSGTAFAARAARLLEAGRSPTLRAVVGQREPTAADLHTAATQGDALCEAEIRHGGHLLGLAFGSLVNVLNPEAITLSGGLLNMGEMLLEPLRRGMYSIAYGPASGTIVHLSTLGDDAGLLGAAAVALEHLT